MTAIRAPGLFGSAVASYTPPPRYLMLAGIAAFHIALFWLFAMMICSPVPVRIAHDVDVTFFSPNLTPRQPLAPPLDWQFETPEQVLVPEPEITITTDGSGGVVGNAIAQRLTPRLDPTHVNSRPDLPEPLQRFAAAAELVLRIFVEPDGSVAFAQITRSTGVRDIDHVAIDYVKANWHYLPASINGKPIEAWTTVIVRFAPMH